MSLSARNPSKILGLFAKEPIPGQVKTRLGRETNPPWACRVALALLEDTLERLSSINVRRMLVYAPEASRAFFVRLAAERFELAPQSNGNLGDRLQDFFEHARRQGYSHIVAVGADSPTLPLDYIDRAFAALDTHDVVIGPAQDGGYYLIGSGPRELGMFEGIPWSSANVLEQTIARLRQASARLALLPPWYDVDTVDDWAMLRGHVAALRLAGIDPGMPRLERLIQEQSV